MISYIRRFPQIGLIVVSAWMNAPTLFGEEGVGGERIVLSSGRALEEGTEVEDNALLTIYHPEKPNGTAIIICPGGGYGVLVQGPEGTGIAEWLAQQGIVGIVLEYRLPHGDPNRPLSDVQRAIRMVRANAREWKCDPTRIGVMGFSAGGHLASTAVTHFEGGSSEAADPLERMSSRPDFGILIYPVITMGSLTHAGSKRNLLGSNPVPARVELFSNEKQITKETPPCFLAHALDDTIVSSENSRMFYEALRANDIEAKYLELPSGGHGLNGYQGPMWEAWKKASLGWLRAQQLLLP
mgnify:CR=1 FL=1